MSAGWPTRTLGEFCDVLDSKRKPITKSDRISGKYPYYGATGILDYVEGYIFDERLVLVGEDGAKWGPGERTAFGAEGKYWVNNHAHVIRPRRHLVIDDWIVYYLNWADLSRFITGLTVPKLNQEKMRDISLPLPPLPEQKRIVAILDEAFEGIGTAVANAEKNLANAYGLLERCMVSALSGQSGTRRRAVRELAAAERGSIRTGPFGSQLLHSEFVDAGIAVLGIDNVVENRFVWSRRRYITAEKYAALRRYTVRPGDVLISIMATCGRCAVVPDDIELAINSKHLCCISLNRNLCLPEYLHVYFLFHPLAREYLAAQSKGSIMDGLNMGIIQEMPVLVPSVTQQSAIAELFIKARGASERLADVQTRKIALLGTLGQAILQKAFAGELTARSVDTVLEAAE